MTVQTVRNVAEMNTNDENSYDENNDRNNNTNEDANAETMNRKQQQSSYLFVVSPVFSSDFYEGQ